MTPRECPLMTQPSQADRRCPNCGNPLPPGSTAACSNCGFAAAAGIVHRDKPHETRGLEALARKFGPRWSFGAAGLMVVVGIIYYADIASAEQNGGSFNVDPF